MIYTFLVFMITLIYSNVLLLLVMFVNLHILLCFITWLPLVELPVHQHLLSVYFEVIIQ